MGIASVFDAELNNFNSCKQRKATYAAVTIELEMGLFLWISRFNHFDRCCNLNYSFQQQRK